jgi:DNA-binding transcriptional ArsR family regulator
MVIQAKDADVVDLVFHALADATRRDIVARTMVGGQSVSALASHYEMSFPAVHKHIAVLERAGLVTKAREGREQLVRARVEQVRRASRLLDELADLWVARLGRLGEILAEPQEGEGS